MFVEIFARHFGVTLIVINTVIISALGLWIRFALPRVD